MKKIGKSSELLWILGVLLVALGVAICSKTELGVSMIAAPAFVVSEALLPLSAFFSVGVTEYILQGILLIIMCIAVQRFNWRYLLAFVVAVLYGYTLDLFLFFFENVSFTEVWLRYIMLLVGDAITALGVACFFRTYMPLQVYELFVAEVSGRYTININKVKWGFDLSLLAISVVLALSLFGDVKTFDWSNIWATSFHNIGLGTILTTIINSPIIAMWGKVLDKIFFPSPLIPKLEGLLKRKSSHKATSEN